jgi:hypothetical protein
MTNPFPDFYTGLRAAITAVWPDIAGASHPIYRASQVRRIDWRKLIEREKLASPWVIVSVSDSPEASSWGMGNVIYSPRVEVFFVTEGVTSERDMASYIEERLIALRDILTLWQQGFQFAGGVSIDTSAANPVGSVFLAEKMPLWAGSIAFDVRFCASGELPVFFSPRQLVVCEVAPFTITTSGSSASAVVNSAAKRDLLSVVDAVSYNPTETVSDFAPEDADIADYRSGGKDDFAITLGCIDGDGRESALMDLWHAKWPALRFALRAKNLDGSLGKWFVAYATPASLRNGVVYGKNATMITLRPTWGVQPQWTSTPTI